MKTTVLRIAAIACLLAPTAALSQPAQFFNPGIKIGYIFGDNGGVVAGIELSYTTHAGSFIMHGPVLALDYSRETFRLHAGYEASMAIGLGFGPTLLLRDGSIEVGFGTTVFTGFLVFPYYSFTHIGDSTYNESGMYLKAHTQVSGRSIWH